MPPATSWSASQTAVGSFVAPLSRPLGGTGATDSAGIANIVGTIETITGTGTQSIAANTSIWNPSVGGGLSLTADDGTTILTADDGTTTLTTDGGGSCADTTLNLPSNPVDNEPHTIVNPGLCLLNSLTIAGNGHNIGLADSIVSITPGAIGVRYSSASGAWEIASASISGGLSITPLNAALNLSDVANAATARTNLGLGTIATQNANAVAITGGTTTGITTLGVTGPSTFVSTPVGTLSGNCYIVTLGCIPTGGYAVNMIQVSPGSTGESVALTTAGAFLLADVVVHNYGGSTINGGRESFGVFASLTAPTSATNTNRNYVAAIFQQNAITGDGGTGLTPSTAKGGIFAINPIAVAFSGATNLLTVTAGEVNMQMGTGSSTLYKSILGLVSTGLDTVHGTSIDTMLLLSAQAAISGDPIAQFQHGIVITDANGANPITPTGVLFGGQIVSGAPTLNAGIGIDLSAFTFATAAYTSTGFAIDPTGGIQGRNLTLGGVLFADSAGATGYSYLHDPAGNAAFVMGSAGNSDPSNYYRNTTHVFQGIGGTGTFAQFDASGVYVPKIAIQSIPTSAGGGGLYVCIDTAGATYKKASCP